MVKADKKRIMITLSLEKVQVLEGLSKKYDMPVSQVINMLLVDKIEERK